MNELKLIILSICTYLSLLGINIFFNDYFGIAAAIIFIYTIITVALSGTYDYKIISIGLLISMSSIISISINTNIYISILFLTILLTVIYYNFFFDKCKN